MAQSIVPSIPLLGNVVSTPSGPAPHRHGLSFHGTGSSLFLLILKNVLLTIVTLGVYAPWAATARRKYVWQNVEFHGQRFIYGGTGLELLLGYLKVLVGYAVFLGLPALVRLVSPNLAIAVQIVFAVGLVLLIPFAVYWSRAYLLSRSTWRGIHFSMQPGAGSFARTFLVGYLLTLVTLGLYMPVWLNKVRRIITERSRFGNHAFRYDGDDFEVWVMSMKGLLLSIVTLGIYYFWFRAELSRYELEHTHFGQAKGRLELTGGDVFKFTMIYLFGTTLTLGLAFPWVATYVLRSVLERTSFEGHIDFAAITQSEARGNAAADGLADVMDVGLSI
jgi:uncharacterized membrane protein YjgN (DUF898 family)